MDQHSYIKETEVISRIMVVVYSITTLVPTVPHTMHTLLVTLEQSVSARHMDGECHRKAIYGCHLHIASKNHFYLAKAAV